MRVRSSSLAVSLLLLAGCGGGGSAPTGGSEVENDYGMVSTRSTGSVGAPVLVSAGNLSVMGLAGASFSEVRLNFPPATALNREEVRAKTQLGVSVYDHQGVLNYGSGGIVFPDVEATNSQEAGFPPVLAPQGDRMYRVRWDSEQFTFVLDTVFLDGSKVVRLAQQLGADLDLSPDGSTLVSSQPGGIPIMTVATSNGAKSILRPDSPEYACARFSPDGKRIAAILNGKPVVMNADGSNESAAMAFPPASLNVWQLDWLDNEHLVMAYDWAYGKQIGFTGIGSNDLNEITTVSDQVISLAVSPDGGRIAFTQLFDGVLRMVSVSGSYPVVYPTSSPVYRVSWGPYIRQKNIIGAGASLPAGAGFLVGQRGKDITSYVSFDAVTRSGATIVPGTGNGTANLLFDIRSTDGISQIRFSNELFAKAANPTTGTVAGFLVSFDTASGDVAAVIPYQGTSPKVRAEGSRLNVEGDLVGVWDGRGERKVAMTKQARL